MGDNVTGWRPVSTAAAIKVDFTTSATGEQLSLAYMTAYDSKPKCIEVTNITTGETYDLSIRQMAHEDGSGVMHNIVGVVLRSRVGRTASTAYKGWSLTGFIDLRRGIGEFTMKK